MASAGNDYHIIPISSEQDYEERTIISTKEGLSGAKSLLEKDSVAVVFEINDREREILYESSLSEIEKNRVNQTLEEYLIENNLSPLYKEVDGNIVDEIEDVWNSVHGQVTYPLKSKKENSI